MLRSLSLHRKDRFFQSLEEHAAIVQAYKKLDQELLIKTVKYHLTMFKDNILKSNNIERSGRVVVHGILGD
jgi:DNA-binding GntR family transcriptional regulator